MKYDIILSGVGGQGVLSLAAIIAKGAMLAGKYVRQSEVHGMSQRGGAVLAHMRISDDPIASDLIGHGMADMILSMEPLESLRYLDYLKPGAWLVTSADPVNNIPNYPDLDSIHRQIRALDNTILVESAKLARDAGSIKAGNMVMVGAASLKIALDPQYLIDAMKELFASKGEEVIQTNLIAFAKGRGE